MFEICMTLIDEECDKGAFEKLYNSQKQKLYYIAYRILHDEQLAEEAVSETFFNIARKFNTFRSLTNEQIEAYCILALKNTCKNIIRENSKDDCINIDDCKEDDSFLSDNELQHIDSMYLREKIMKLKYIDKEILLLYYFYDLSLKEIAKMKDISNAAAQKRLQQARKNLRVLLEADSYERC
ncbi:MAG: sigma-70 family RNA polymerase sigma factor [Oscillospiraceae bacterium]|nr:sigma-70 family RNA polymerase sigma factor [Oscillospiraceae bacterium]